MFFPSRNRARLITPIAGIVAVLLLPGCTPRVSVTTAVVDPNPTVSIAVLPLSGTGIDPVTQVVVEAELGVLTQVSVLGPTGEVPGILSDDGSRWSSTGAPLEYSANYVITTEAADARGRVTSLESKFSTLEPEKFFTADVSPSEGEVVGVGEPIVVTFNKRVENKAEVEAAMTVRTSRSVLGAWGVAG